MQLQGMFFVFKTHTTPGAVAIFQIVIVDMEMECAQTTQLQKHDYTKNSIRSNKRQKKKKKTVHFVVFNCSTTTNKMTLTDKVSNPSGKTSLNTTA